jgi:nucleoside-diphosphate-sugar epimerase
VELPHTIIDVGWWWNGFIPELPSGRTDYAIALQDFIKNLIPGDGNMKTNVVDPESVGTIVARILADPRTVDRRVMASETAMSFNEMFDTAEALAGEKIKRKYVCHMLVLSKVSQCA